MLEIAPRTRRPTGVSLSSSSGRPRWGGGEGRFDQHVVQDLLNPLAVAVCVGQNLGGLGHAVGEFVSESVSRVGIASA
jgi:hypothetical protein